MAPADLLALADRVAGLSGPDREVDWLVWFNTATEPADHRNDNWPSYTASVDCVLALIAEKLPGCTFMLDTRAIGGPIRAKMFPPPIVAHSDDGLIGHGATPALALLSGALKAIRRGALATQEDTP